MACIDDRTMYELIDGELKGDARREAIKHIEGCDKCMARMRELVGFEITLGDAWSKFRKEECPSAETLHDYSEGDLSEEERSQVEKHLKRCEICAFVLEESAALTKEYARQEERWLKDNRQRLGSQLYEKVKRFLAERFSEAQAILEQADAFRFQLKPVALFRGRKPERRDRPRLPVVCKSGSVIIVVTGKDPSGVRVRLMDEKEEIVAEESCSPEGIAAFLDIPTGYYLVEVVDE